MSKTQLSPMPSDLISNLDAVRGRRELKLAVDHEIAKTIDRLSAGGTAVQLKEAAFPGRRLRPTLFLALCRNGSGGGSWRPSPVQMQIAVAIELCHRASIVVDDLMDGDSVRRGLPTYHRQWGESAAILHAHHLVSLAFSVLSNAAPALTSQFAEAYSDTCLGQAGDLAMLPPEREWLAFYENVVLRKTSSLFAFTFAAACAHQQHDLMPKVADWTRLGEAFGKLYQAQNDFYDDFLACTDERGQKPPVGLSVSLGGCIVLDYGTHHDRAAVESCLRPIIPTHESLRQARAAIRVPEYLDRARMYIRDMQTNLELQITEAAPSTLGAISPVISFLSERDCWDHDQLSKAGY